MNDITLRLYEFTGAPAGRYREEGDFSGEEFREDYIEPNYKRALENNVKLFIDINGCEGCPSSFYNEAFWGLIKK